MQPAGKSRVANNPRPASATVDNFTTRPAPGAVIVVDVMESEFELGSTEDVGGGDGEDMMSVLSCRGMRLSCDYMVLSCRGMRL